MNPIQARKQTGQALVELVVVAPVILSLLICAIPLAGYGIFPTWIDERLALTHLASERDQSLAFLSSTHDDHRIPTYPDKYSIQESSHNIRPNYFQPAVPGILPDRIVRLELQMPLSREELIFGNIFKSWSVSAEMITRSLSLLVSQNIKEQDISGNVKIWSLVGAMKGKDTAFRKLGIELFHIDLDSIPVKETKWGK